MRILLLTADQHTRNGLARALEDRGHEVLHATAGGEELLATAEHAGRLHAAVLSEVALGNGWPRLVRQLRRSAPYLPTVVLLGPGSNATWRLAILAGAFEALPESTPQREVFHAVSRALNYAAGKPPSEKSLPRSGGITGQSAVQAVALDVPAGAARA